MKHNVNRTIYTGLYSALGWAALGAALLLFAAGCGTFSSDSITAEGAKGYAACIIGSGPPLTGSGHIARAKVDKDFVGTIEITPDCGIRVLSAHPQ